MKTLSFTLAAIFTVSASAQSVTLKPFEFKDASLAQRSDIKKEYARQSYQVPLSYAQTLVQDTDTEAKLNVFPETLKLMQQFRRFGNGSGPTVQTPKMCAQHNSNITIPNLGSCPAANTLQLAMNQKSKVCRDVETPEKYMLEYPEYTGFKEAYFTNNGIMSLIEAAGKYLLQHEWPQGVISQEMADRGRAVLLRMRYSTIKQKINEQKNLYTQILQQLNTSGCVNVASSLSSTISSLSQELNKADAYLEQVYQTGLAQAQADQQKVIANKRIREALPFPALTDSDREFVSFYVLGVYWRLRGGGIFPNVGTQTRRKTFAQYPIEKIIELNCGAKCNAGVKGIGDKMRMKLIMKGWGDWADMGSWQGEGAKDRFHDMTFMTWRGEYQIDNSAEALAKAKYPSAPLFLSGLQMGSTYWYPTVLGMNVVIKGPPAHTEAEAITAGPWPMGEVFQGATMGLGLARSLLPGRTK